MTEIISRASAHLVFPFGSNNVRVFADDHGEPWFCATDVCAVLGYANSRQAVRKNCREKGVSIRDTPTDGGMQALTFINEGNLYRLIIKSRKPEAEAFEQKVMEEILPSIRKTGQYIAQPYANNPGDTLSLEQADVLRNMLTDAAKARFPEDGKKQGAFIMRGWSKLKSHFKSSYREIPQGEFSEAVSLVARHIIEGELVDSPKTDMVSRAHVVRCMNLMSAVAGPSNMMLFSQLINYPEDDVQMGRFLLAFSGDTPVVKPIEDDAVVFSWKNAANLLRDPAMPVDSSTLQDVATAAIERLTRRIPQNALVRLS